MCLFFEMSLELMREPVSAVETALKSACANVGKKLVCMPAVLKSIPGLSNTCQLFEILVIMFVV